MELVFLNKYLFFNLHLQNFSFFPEEKDWMYRPDEDAVLRKMRKYCKITL